MSPSRPGILILSDHLGHSNGQIHGATRYFLDVLPRISKERFRLHVCFLREEHPEAETLRRQGIHPIFLGKSKWDFTAYRDLVQLIRQQQIQLLHAAAMKSMLLGRLAARHCGIPALIHFHDALPVSQPLLSAQRMLSSSTAAGIAISRPVAEFAKETFRLSPEKIRILPNGIDLSAFKAAPCGEAETLRRELRIPAHHRVLLSVGRLDDVKDPLETLRIFYQVHQNFPESNLVFAGDGYLSAELLDTASSLGIANAVHLAGHCKNIHTFYALADVFIASPKHEGFGLAAAEAMAAGLPIVAYAVGGIPDLIENGVSGFLIEPGKTAAASETVQNLFANPSLVEQIGTSAMTRVRRFDVNRHVKLLESCYEEFLLPAT